MRGLGLRRVGIEVEAPLKTKHPQPKDTSSAATKTRYNQHPAKRQKQSALILLPTAISNDAGS